MLTPFRFIGKEIQVLFDESPALSKKPGCPDGFALEDEAFRVVELLEEWSDHSRKGRFARNMQPEHASVAAKRGSWGVGRMFFRVRADCGRCFELYYDRAPKDATHRKGAWFLRCELREA